MPTYGWTLEDTIERYWEAQPTIIPTDQKTEFTCKRCKKTFSTVEELQRHLNLEHPLELPVLYVFGEPLSSQHVFRSTIKENDIKLLQCSYCRVKKDGGQWERLEISEFSTQFTQPKNSTWNVLLIHERSIDNAQSLEEYNIQFRIPTDSSLNKVDELFIRTLAHEKLNHNDLEQFQSALPIDTPTREYGDALGDYALGIILKERQHLSQAIVPFEEFVAKMRSSLEILRLFKRPVALVVSSSIRFNLNDFHDYGKSAEPKLETALMFFHNIINQSISPHLPDLSMFTPEDLQLRPICPVDQISYRLVSACFHLSQKGLLSLSELEDLEGIIHGDFLVSEQDIVKIKVICAEGYLRLDRPSEALPYLHAVQFNPVFKEWVESHLKRI